MTFRTRLPELRFEINEATVISVLTEWVRDTYELAAREYKLEFVKSAIDNQYHVTASFIDVPVRQPVSFQEIAEQERESTFNDSAFPSFTFAIRQPYSTEYTESSEGSNADPNVSEEHRGSDNGVPAPKV